jgi:hypothetical protein
VEVLLENKHAGNLVSVVAPLNTNAPSMFKWANGFSWAYSGNIADSMKQRVKAAGGNVDGVLRFSIQWNEEGNNNNDLDAHSIEPDENLIHFPSKGRKHPSSGMLDVDIVNPSRHEVAVENITWTNLNKMPEGVYKMVVHTYANRGGTGGFRAEVEFNGELHEFDYPHPTSTGEYVHVADVTYSKTKGFSIKKHLEGLSSSKTLWGKQTNTFHPVSSIMYSPNYWDELSGNGNKHYFFMIDGCVNPERPNGFFNEFLRNDLLEHKRVFEALASKMQVQSDDPKQLSGVGFSSTQRNSLVCRVTGYTQRVIKIEF